MIDAIAAAAKSKSKSKAVPKRGGKAKKGTRGKKGGDDGGDVVNDVNDGKEVKRDGSESPHVEHPKNASSSSSSSSIRSTPTGSGVGGDDDILSASEDDEDFTPSSTEGDVDGEDEVHDDHGGDLDGHVRQTTAQKFGFSKWYYDTARSRTRGAFTLALQARTFWRDARNKNECDTLAAILDALEERNIWLAREIAIRRSIGIQQAEDFKGKNDADRWHEADIMAFWNRRSWMSDEDSRELRRDAHRYRSTVSSTTTSSRVTRPRSSKMKLRSKKGGGGGARMKKKKAPSSADDD